MCHALLMNIKRKIYEQHEPSSTTSTGTSPQGIFRRCCGAKLAHVVRSTWCSVERGSFIRSEDEAGCSAPALALVDEGEGPGWG